MENTETIPQKIVERKIIILKPRLDPDAVKLLGENKKTCLFTRFGFLRPRPIDISLVSFNKYYEPIVTIGGKYTIDYCKKHFFELKTDSQAQKIFVGGKEFKFEPLDSEKLSKVFRITGEEHSHYENETYFILDRLMREISPEKVHLAPFENATENSESYLFDLRKFSISLEEEIAFLSSRIVKKPSNAEVIIREIFEINERTTIYNPIYELVFQNAKTAKVATLLIDGVTSKLTIVKFDSTDSKKLGSQKNLSFQTFSKAKPDSFQEIPKNPSNKDPSITNKLITDSVQHVPIQQETSSNQISESKPKFEAEDATALAMDSLKRLGLGNKMTPLKVFTDGESYVVELNLQDKTAKVWVNTKTKEIKEYEIQETISVI